MSRQHRVKDFLHAAVTTVKAQMGKTPPPYNCDGVQIACKVEQDKSSRKQWTRSVDLTTLGEGFGKNVEGVLQWLKGTPSIPLSLHLSSKQLSILVMGVAEETPAVTAARHALWGYVESINVRDEKPPTAHTALSLSCFTNLRSLSAWQSPPLDLKSLANCAKLEELHITQGPWLSSIEDFVGNQTLRKLSVNSTAVADVTGLALCTALEELNVEGCSALTSLAPLAGSRSLRRLSAWSSGVVDLSGLNECPALKELVLIQCPSLTSLAPIAGSQSLQVVYARYTNVADISGLGTCSALERLDVSNCKQLASLAPLAGCTSLQDVSAEGSGVSDLTGLNTCTGLKTVSLGNCDSLQTLYPLTLHPGLEAVCRRGRHVLEVARMVKGPHVFGFHQNGEYFERDKPPSFTIEGDGITVRVTNPGLPLWPGEELKPREGSLFV